jgi:RNA polymerase sigma-70 factor (ECF subfamily)
MGSAALRQYYAEGMQAGATDRELLTRSAAGDERAFHTLYERHQRVVYRFALFASGGSAATAEEAVQETFLLLIRNPGRFDPERGALAAYLCGIARQMVRRSRRRPFIALEESQEVGGDPLGDLAQRERLDALRQAVLALPARYREAVTLCHLEGLSYRDAAQVLECSEGTVCSRLSRARALLVKKLAGLAICLI